MMTKCPEKPSRESLVAFHKKLDYVAERYKGVNKLPETPSQTFAAEFCQMSRDMEFELLDHIVSHVKTLGDMDEVRQQFILKMLKGDISVSDDRFDNLVQIAKVTNLTPFQ